MKKIDTKPAGGPHSFVVFAGALGLAYAYTAWKRQGILWTAIAHILLISQV
jgi:hypothetical protein